MFCTKCGFNAGESKFCPKCGSPLKKAPNAETTSNEVVNNTTVDASSTANFANNDSNNQSATSTNTTNQGFNNGFNQANNFSQPQAFGSMGGFDQAQFGTANNTPKPKKKWPKIVAIVAAILVVIGVAGYFTYPLIANALSPKAKAVTALKNLGKNVDSYVDDFTKTDFSSETEADVTSQLSLNKAEVNGKDYASYLEAKTIKYDIQTNLEDSEFAGTLSLCDSSDKDVLTLKFYTDTDKIYFSCPELFSETLSVDYDEVISTYSDYSAELGSLASSGSIDLDSMDQYSEEIKAVVSDVLKGYYTFVDNLSYTKKGNETFKSENGDIKVTKYEVSINRDAVVKGFNSAVDALYNDKKLSSYVSLVSSLSGYSKDKLKSSFESELGSFEPVTFEMSVNKKNEIVRLAITEDDASIFAEFIGKKDTLDYVHTGITFGSDSMDLVVKNEDKKYSANFTMNIPSEDIKTLTVLAEVTKNSDKEFTLDKFSIVGEIDSDKINFEVSGSMKANDFTGLDFTKSDFKNPIDVSTMTSAQESALTTEVITHLGVFEKVLSPELYKQLMGSMTGLSGVSTPAITGSTIDPLTGTTPGTPATADTSYLGTWSSSEGVSITINADGTGTLTAAGDSLSVYVTVSNGYITITNPADATDTIMYAVSVSGNTMTWSDSDGVITFTKAA